MQQSKQPTITNKRDYSTCTRPGKWFEYMNTIFKPKLFIVLYIASNINIAPLTIVVVLPFFGNVLDDVYLCLSSLFC